MKKQPEIHQYRTSVVGEAGSAVPLGKRSQVPGRSKQPCSGNGQEQLHKSWKQIKGTWGRSSCYSRTKKQLHAAFCQEKENRCYTSHSLGWQHMPTYVSRASVKIQHLDYSSMPPSQHTSAALQKSFQFGTEEFHHSLLASSWRVSRRVLSIWTGCGRYDCRPRSMYSHLTPFQHSGTGSGFHVKSI